jgi:hypothetical protein
MLGWFKRKQVEQTAWSAGAYWFGDRIVIHSESRTYNGVGWYNQPVFGLEANASARELGERLRQALNASTRDSREDDSRVKPHPIVTEAGARSFNHLDEGSKVVCVETDKRTVTITSYRPRTRSDGGGKGLAPMPEEDRIRLGWDSSDADLGQALLAGFKRSVRRKES